MAPGLRSHLLGGSWVAISGVRSPLIWVKSPLIGVVSPLIWVISPLIWVITIVALLITELISTHEPPSRALGNAGSDPRIARLQRGSEV